MNPTETRPGKKDADAIAGWCFVAAAIFLALVALCYLSGCATVDGLRGFAQ
jgi:hypothetical protein